jgi:hypothetical protein
MANDAQVLDPAVIAPTAIEPAPTQTIEPATESPLDPITGTAAPTNPPSNTSNGNQIFVNSPIYSPTASHNTYNVTSITNNNTSVQNHDTVVGQSCSTNGMQQARTGTNYTFESGLYFRGNPRRSRVDRITNFSGGSGDVLRLSRQTFNGIGDLEFVAVSNKRASKRAARTDSDIIYETFSGRLYFNANSEVKGFGKQGGLFAILEGAPVIRSSDFLLF